MLNARNQDRLANRKRASPVTLSRSSRDGGSAANLVVAVSGLHPAEPFVEGRSIYREVTWQRRSVAASLVGGSTGRPRASASRVRCDDASMVRSSAARVDMAAR